jgi:hypothetical protein
MSTIMMFMIAATIMAITIMVITTITTTMLTAMIIRMAMVTFTTSIAVIPMGRRLINSPVPAAGSAAWARSSPWA